MTTEEYFISGFMTAVKEFDGLIYSTFEYSDWKEVAKIRCKKLLKKRGAEVKSP